MAFLSTTLLASTMFCVLHVTCLYAYCTGTSIGAFVGGLYAREGDIISSAARAKKFSSRMGNIWRILSDVTYPIVAYTTARFSALIFFPQLNISFLGT